MSLSGISISLNGWEDVVAKDESESYTVYVITVECIVPASARPYTNVLTAQTEAPPEDMNTWVVRRRFSEFLELHSILKAQGHKNIIAFPFPSRRSIWQSKSAVIESRLASFRQYLAELISMNPIPPEVSVFLEMHTHLKGTIPTSVSSNLPHENVGSEYPRNNKINPDVFSFLNPVSTIISNLSNTLNTQTLDARKASLSENNSHEGDSNMKHDAIDNPASLSSATIASPSTSDPQYTKDARSIGKPNLPPLDTDSQYHANEFRTSKLYYSSRIIFGLVCIVVSYKVIMGLFHPLESLREFGSLVYHLVSNVKVILETVIVMCLFMMSTHRLLGYLWNLNIQRNVRRSDGSYNISVEWVSFRIGLDRNEILFHGTTFHNPPSFKHTPYFIRIEDTRFVVDIYSMIDVLIFGNKSRSIHIILLEMDGINVYVERGEKKSDGINVWAALGAQNDSQEKDVQDYVLHAMAAASNIANPLTSLLKKFGRSRNRSASSSNNLSAMSTDSNHAATNTSNILGHKDDLLTVQSNAVNQIQSIGQFFNNLQSHPQNNDNSQDHTAKLSTSNSLDEDDNAAYVGTWQDVESDDENVPDPAIDPMASEGSPRRNTSHVVASNKGWGMPHIFEVDRWTVHDFKLHAQDFLNAQHSETKAATYIQIKAINMERRELTKPAPKNSTNKRRRGLFFDELSWRMIYRMNMELFTTNQITMVRLIAAATANQTTNAVLDVAKLTSQGISNAVHNYNPVEIFQATKKSLEKVVTSKGINNIRRSFVKSPSIANLGVNALRVRLIKLKDVRMANGQAPATMKCTMWLEYPPESKSGPTSMTTPDNDDSFNTDLVKSSALTKDKDDVICFNEVWFLEPLFSLDAILHLRVYEAVLFAENVFACELQIPIRESIRYGDLESSVDGVDRVKSMTKQDSINTNTNIEITKGNQPRESQSRPISATIANEISGSSNVQKIVSQFNSNRKDCIGIKTDVIAWHSLVGDSTNKDKKLGDIKLGLSLATK